MSLYTLQAHPPSVHELPKSQCVRSSRWSALVQSDDQLTRILWALRAAFIQSWSQASPWPRLSVLLGVEGCESSLPYTVQVSNLSCPEDQTQRSLWDTAAGIPRLRSRRTVAEDKGTRSLLARTSGSQTLHFKKSLGFSDHSLAFQQAELSEHVFYNSNNSS